MVYGLVQRYKATRPSPSDIDHVKSGTVHLMGRFGVRLVASAIVSIPKHPPHPLDTGHPPPYQPCGEASQVLLWLFHILIIQRLAVNCLRLRYECGC